MPKKISERDIQAAIDLLKDSNNYAIVSDNGTVLMNRDISPIKIAVLENVFRECANKWLGIQSRTN